MGLKNFFEKMEFVFFFGGKYVKLYFLFELVFILFYILGIVM